MRVAVYTDYLYHRVDGVVHAERAFALFLAELAGRVDRMVLVGRLHPGGGEARYPLGGVDLVALPYYPSLADLRASVPALFRSAGRFWRALEEVDVVWLLGPHPLAFPFAALALLRRKRVVLGVRQDSVEYVRSRHPGRGLLIAAARSMDLGFRLLARLLPVVVVGPGIARSYERSRSALQIVVSLVHADEVVPPPADEDHRFEGEVRVLSVGRLDAEKNPLALAEVLAILGGDDSRAWRLTVCGEGPLEEALRDRLAELGAGDRAELRGYLPHDAGLSELYRDSDVLLHVSWTEGVPQVLYEAFAARLPVVATDVGGIREAVGRAALLIPPGDPAAAAGALSRIAAEPDLRRQLVEAGIRLVSANTIEAESDRVARFLAGGEASPPGPMLAGG